MSELIELDLDGLVAAAEAAILADRDISSTAFLQKTNDELDAWMASFYSPDADQSAFRLHCLWSWQKQERRHAPIILELVRRLRAAEAAVAAKLSNGFNPSGITALHMDCAGVDIEQLRHLFNDHRTVGQAVIVLPVEAHLEQVDEETMRAAGWVRAERGDA